MSITPSIAPPVTVGGPAPTLSPSVMAGPPPGAGVPGAMAGMPPVMPHIPPELVADPGFSGGYAFETMGFDPTSPTFGGMSRSPVDWGSIKSLGGSSPSEAGEGYGMGALLLGEGGEIWRNMGDSMSPMWHSVGSLYGSSIWSDPAGMGGSLSASLPEYTAPAVSPFGSGGMYGPDPMAAMMSAPLSTSLSAMSAPLSAAPSWGGTALPGTTPPGPASIMAPPLAAPPPPAAAAPMVPPLAATTPTPVIKPPTTVAAPAPTLAPSVVATPPPAAVVPGAVMPPAPTTPPPSYVDPAAPRFIPAAGGGAGAPMKVCDPITGRCFSK
jgi:hypothetical protein